MLKKITTIIASNHNAFVRKATIIGGVTLGIGIGLLLNKAEDPDMVIIEEITDEDDEEVMDESDDSSIED